MRRMITMMTTLTVTYGKKGQMLLQEEPHRSGFGCLFPTVINNGYFLKTHDGRDGALKDSGPLSGWCFRMIDCDFMAFSSFIKFRMKDQVLKADQP